METNNNVPLQEELTFPIEMDNDDCEDDLIATTFEEMTRYSEQNYSDNLVMNRTTTTSIHQGHMKEMQLHISQGILLTTVTKILNATAAVKQM